MTAYMSIIDYSTRDYSNYRHYPINEAFFDVIDTEHKAYWLGFIAADGCVTKEGKLIVALHIKDIEHLRKMTRSMDAGHPVKDIKVKNSRNGWGPRIQHRASLRIGSQKLVRALARVGIHPRKSLTHTFPASDQVPNHLMRHYVRGYFDGDGSIFNKTARPNVWGWSVIGTDAFCRDLVEHLKSALGECSMHLVPHALTNGITNVQCVCLRCMAKIRDYLYKDATVWLDRKHEKFSHLPFRDRPVYEYCDNNIILSILSAEAPRSTAQLLDDLGDIHTLNMIRERVRFLKNVGALTMTGRLVRKGGDKLYTVT